MSRLLTLFGRKVLKILTNRKFLSKILTWGEYLLKILTKNRKILSKILKSEWVLLILEHVRWVFEHVPLDFGNYVELRKQAKFSFFDNSNCVHYSMYIHWNKTKRKFIINFFENTQFLTEKVLSTHTHPMKILEGW